MQGLSSKHMLFAAALILAGGVSWAGALLMSPPNVPSGASEVQLLAHKMNSAPPATITEPTAVTITPEEQSTPVVKPVVKPVDIKKTDTAKKADKTPAPAPGPTVVTVANDDPVKNIALTGVTFEGGKDTALLLDTSSNDRERATVGERVFGFTVRKIDSDSVTLARGSDQYTIRLGDKLVQDPYYASADTGSDPLSDPTNQFGGGRNRFGRNGFGGFGRNGFGGFGRNGFGRNGFGGFGGFPGRGGFGGANATTAGFGGGPGGGGAPTVFNSGGNGNNGGGFNRGGNRPQVNIGFNGGGGGFGGGGFGGQGGAFGQTNSTSTRSSTSNPQTALRTGASLISGSTSRVSKPQTISNPQTQRRLGTTSGPAFGSGSGSSNNRNGTSRTTGGTTYRTGSSTTYR
jgi:hypothetical protein